MTTPYRVSLVTLALGTLFAAPATAQQIGNLCVRDFQPGAVCTANDVRVQAISLVTLIEDCGTGVIGEAEAIFEVLVSAEGSPERYDIGIFLALDGGSARDGDLCLHDYLEPPLTSVPIYGDANMDMIPDLVGGPWFDADSDTCGDLATNTQVFKTTSQLRLTCTDRDNSGFVDANVCPSWDNNVAPVCSSLSEAFPGTNSKCGCTTLDVGIPVAANVANIVVTKNPPTQSIPVGSTASFTMAVNNTGTVDLSNIVIQDPQCTTISGPTGDNGDAILQTTETWTYTCDTTNVTSPFTNVVTVTGTPPSGPNVTDSASADVLVVTPVPTLGRLQLVVFAGLLFSIGALHLMRRRRLQGQVPPGPEI
jgi:uncharacterized repeat protein (TIGR01451 family)